MREYDVRGLKAEADGKQLTDIVHRRCLMTATFMGTFLVSDPRR